jgi:hypothetical protein
MLTAAGLQLTVSTRQEYPWPALDTEPEHGFLVLLEPRASRAQYSLSTAYPSGGQRYIDTVSRFVSSLQDELKELWYADGYPGPSMSFARLK